MTAVTPIMEAEAPPLTILMIQQVVADHFKLRIEMMRSDRRAIRFARPRQIAMYLAHTMLPLRSLPVIGKAFGRDHTTVMHAVERIGDLIIRRSEMAEEIRVLQRKVIAAGRLDLQSEMAMEIADSTAQALRGALFDAARSDPAGFITAIAAAVAGRAA